MHVEIISVQVCYASVLIQTLVKEFPRKSNARSQIARFFKSEGYLYLRERFLVSVCCAGEICAVSYTEGAQNRQAPDLPVLK